VKELREEIAIIREANDLYKRQEHHTLKEIQANTRRLEMLGQILQELTELTQRLSVPTKRADS